MKRDEIDCLFVFCGRSVQDGTISIVHLLGWRGKGGTKISQHDTADMAKV
jgi:hypothetical protein